MRRAIMVLSISAVAAFALSSIAAGAAQAQPLFFYKGAELKEKLKLVSKSSEPARLWVTAVKVVIVCKATKDKGEINNGEVEVSKVKTKVGINEKTTVEYTECVTKEAVLNKTTKKWEEGKELTTCKPYSNNTSEGSGAITTNALKSFLAFYPKTTEVVDVLLPESGETFVALKFPEECSLYTKAGSEVKGSVIGKVELINKPKATNKLLFEVTNEEAGVTQKPVSYELNKDEEKDSLTFAGHAAAYEGNETIELENKAELEVQS